MRVLVTGHEGYIGALVVPVLHAAGHEVVGLDTGFYAGFVLGPPPEEVPARRLDVRDVEPEHCHGVDAVVHLAALCNDRLGDVDAGLTLAINHRATVRLARAAREAGVTRFVFSSSCSLYGAGSTGASGAVLDERAPFEPLTPYGESKVLAERDVGALADDSFSPVFLRNATAYGFSPRLRCDLVVNDLVASAVLTGEVRLRSDGTAWRPLVHVADIAAAILAALEAPREVVHGRAYNVGRNSENHLIRDVADAVADAVPGSSVTVAGGAGPDRRSYRVSCTRIAEDLPGFRPRWDLRAGIEELVGAYRRHGLTEEQARGPHCRRLGAIEALRHGGRLDDDLRWREPQPA